MLAHIPGPLRRLRLRITSDQAQLPWPAVITQPHLGVLLTEVDAQAYVQRLGAAVPTLADAAVAFVDGGGWAETRVGTSRRTSADEPEWMKGALDPGMYEVGC